MAPGLLAVACAGWSVGVPSALAQEVPALPTLGDSASEDLTVADERALGDRIMRQVLPDPDVLDDALLQEYVESIWQPLVASARRRGDLTDELAQHYAWRTFLVRDRTVNAFALPGGYVGVHLGLIAMTASRDELASVLAHELSHVTQRHIARSMGTQKRQSAVSIATLLLGVMAAARSPNAANALITGGQALAMQGQLNFSRDMEREADRVGYGVLTTAGFDGAGMAAMFDHLQNASRLVDNNQYPYLRTHPLTTERIAEARSRLGVNTSAGVRSPAEAQWLHAYMRGRARALMDTRSETLQRLTAKSVLGSSAGAESAEGASGAFSDAVAAALAARRLRDDKAEDVALNRARGLASNRPAALRALGMQTVEMWLDRRQPREAARALAQLSPDASRAGVFLSCRVALALPGPQAGLGPCAEDLQSQVSVHPEDGAAWSLLGQAREQQGQHLAALHAQAEVQWAQGDARGAADRLRAAQQWARSHQQWDTVEASVIEARLKVFERRRREDMEQERRNGAQR